MTNRLKGIVLAGGKSRRFGEDKALALVDGLSMIERSVHLLSELDLNPIIITRETSDYAFLGCRIEKDLIPDKGPLGGIYTACNLFQDASLLVLTCDMPALTTAVLKVLMEQHRREYEVSLFAGEGKRLQPFPGIYESQLASRLRESIQQDHLSMQGFITSIKPHRTFDFDGDPNFLRNINHKEDLDEAKS